MDSALLPPDGSPHTRAAAVPRLSDRTRVVRGMARSPEFAAAGLCQFPNRCAFESRRSA
jgi:hypothetical protein